MKQFFTLLFATIVFCSFFAPTQPGEIDNVIAALKAGNSDQMAQHFDTLVEINIAGQNNSYNKPQAIAVLKSFFSANPVKGFSILHKGDKGGAQFCIGSLSTKGGTYRTTLFMKQKGERQVLQQLKFEN